MRNRLKKLRQQRHWSQSDLARGLGISRQAVNGFESGKFAPSLDMAFKIASLFDVAIEDIFIYEAKNTMQMLIEQVKSFLGFDFGFERFNAEAIHAIKVAQSEAARSQSQQVEPDHLLKGLLADPNSTSTRLLQGHGVTMTLETHPDNIRESETKRFSPQSKFIFELSLQIVRLQRKQSIGTEHLLWGLLRLTETNQLQQTQPGELFQQLQVNLEALNRELIEII
jgi:putative transcriptional regulator